MGGLTARDFRVYGGLKTTTNPAYDLTVPGQDYSGFVKTMYDVTTSGYRERVARGIRVNNPYTRSLIVSAPYLALSYRRTDSNGSWEVTNGPTVARIFGRLSTQLPANPINVENHNRIATVKAWAAVEPAKSQSLVTVLEAHKSWKTIIDRARKLAKVVEACRRKDVKALQSMLPGSRRTYTSKKTMLWDDDGRPLLDKRGQPRRTQKAYSFTNDRRYRDEASQLWLEYRYGWSPMVYDMIDSLKAVYAADLRHNLLPRDIFLAKGASTETVAISTNLSASFGGLSYTGNRTTSFEYKVNTYIHYRWSAPDGILRRLNDFGLFDVPKAIWEICPFSFIADWFIPVGDWLGAITPKIGVEIIDNGFTTSNNIDARQVLSGFPTPVVGGTTYQPAAPLGSQDSYTALQVDRSVYLGIPLYPPIDVKINIKRMADVAALFRGIR